MQRQKSFYGVSRLGFIYTCHNGNNSSMKQATLKNYRGKQRQKSTEQE